MVFTTRKLYRLLLVGLFFLLADSALLAEPLTATVTEVRGPFCKLDLTAKSGIRKGMTARLAPAKGDKRADLIITAVLENYSVGKVTGSGKSAGKTLQVGDQVVFESASSAVANNKETVDEELKPAAQQSVLDSIIGKQIKIELKSGRQMPSLTLLSVERDSTTGDISSFRVKDPDSANPRTLGYTAVAKIVHDGRELSLEELAPDAGSSSPMGTDEGGSSKKTYKSKRQLLAEQKAAREAEEKKRWLARLKVRGIEPWPELTEQQHKAAIAEHEELVEKVMKTYPKMTFHRTEHFHVCTNIPYQQMRPYIVSLDNMHNMMCKMYNIKPGTKVWRGKALVVAFLNQVHFIDFEARFMGKRIPPGVYGLCHMKGNGDVVMACFRGDKPEDFGQMLVHETSHGFIHRYKTPIRFPNWVNEGMADWVGLALVPNCKSVKLAEQAAILRMKQTGSMGGDFLTTSHISAWQYGLASNLADFMIRTNREGYVKFIEGLKEGMSVEESLQASYNSSLAGLVRSYGRAIGVPNLQP